ncbi:hypothetical protein Taro_017711, partial [Colocasia esculenta]|nr:hypothetical protein [Colocasia esculenta]
RRPKGEEPEMLAARSLRKAHIPTTLLGDPSPGSIQPTRLAIHVKGDGNGESSSCSIYVASGCQVYRLEVSNEGSSPVKGKDSLLVPAGAQVTQSSVVDRCPHRSEIQSIALAERDDDTCILLGTVDSFGHLIVSRLDANGADIDRHSYTIAPRGYGVGEGSWAGICFSPIYSSTAATVHSLCKSIDVYDHDIHLCSFQTIWYPNSLSFLQCSQLGGGSSSVLAVAEGSQLTIWDLRTSGGCVQRVCGSIGDLIYAISSSPSGAVAAGGSDRTVTIYDPRRWSALSRWVGCSKYEVTFLFLHVYLITGLAFSSLNSDYMFSVDDGKRAGEHFHLEGTQTGWDARTDVLAGWCDSGSIFVADIVKEQEESL